LAARRRTQVLALPVIGGSQSYLDWVARSTVGPA
jgi:hypothetical protein